MALCCPAMPLRSQASKSAELPEGPCSTEDQGRAREQSFCLNSRKQRFPLGLHLLAHSPPPNLEGFPDSQQPTLLLVFLQVPGLESAVYLNRDIT